MVIFVLLPLVAGNQSSGTIWAGNQSSGLNVWNGWPPLLVSSVNVTTDLDYHIYDGRPVEQAAKILTLIESPNVPDDVKHAALNHMDGTNLRDQVYESEQMMNLRNSLPLLRHYANAYMNRPRSQRRIYNLNAPLPELFDQIVNLFISASDILLDRSQFNLLWDVVMLRVANDTGLVWSTELSPFFIYQHLHQEKLDEIAEKWMNMTNYIRDNKEDIKNAIENHIDALSAKLVHENELINTTYQLGSDVLREVSSFAIEAMCVFGSSLSSVDNTTLWMQLGEGTLRSVRAVYEHVSRKDVQTAFYEAYGRSWRNSAMTYYLKMCEALNQHADDLPVRVVGLANRTLDIYIATLSSVESYFTSVNPNDTVADMQRFTQAWNSLFFYLDEETAKELVKVHTDMVRAVIASPYLPKSYYFSKYVIGQLRKINELQKSIERLTEMSSTEKEVLEHLGRLLPSGLNWEQSLIAATTLVEAYAPGLCAVFREYCSQVDQCYPWPVNCPQVYLRGSYPASSIMPPEVHSHLSASVSLLLGPDLSSLTDFFQ